uniref:Neuron navigator 1 n=1 Tax=Paramormyrops kingsleyae TaxID=1676925 RepID=A0A3B3SHE1_9TELE
MLGASLKGREVALEAEREGSSETYGQAESKRTPGSMAARRGKTGIPAATPRSELRVYRGGNPEGRPPVPAGLRKQKSLTNLCVLTDAEKKMQLSEPKWCDDMSKPASAHLKAGKPKEAGLGGSVGASPLSRSLSKSEHSLFQGKPKPFSPLAAPTTLGKPSRIPRGPYAEVKPISKAPEPVEDSKSDDEILSSKANANANTKKLTDPPGPMGKGQGVDGEGKPYLKVDPELVVTVLGDLEQLLFSQMLDPESQRKRTVQNVLDLRQNLEDTMSSLRGSQLSHSCLETGVCYDSDETNARSVSSLSNRSSPLSWHYGQSSPRLQAGDAPSSTGGPVSGTFGPHGTPVRAPSHLSRISRIELVESLHAEDGNLKSGYLSDSDLWDESSSISSGLSDGSDNLSSEECNGSSSLTSLPTSPVGSRRNSAVVLRTDAEKRSLVESGLSWYSEDGKAHHKADSSAYDTGSLKTESSRKWRKSRPQETTGGEDGMPKGELKKPQTLGHPGALKKGRNPPVGVTSPITHTSQSVLKVAGDDQKALDKAKMAVKATGLQRSCSDAGKERGETRKPPSGLVRPSPSGSFGYKKLTPATGTATVMTAGGTTISGGSATVGKTPRSSGIPVKPVGGGRKTSLDVANCDPGFLSPNARTNIQYRSLPRPAKPSAMSLTGRCGPRPVSSSMDTSVLSLKPVSLTCATGGTGGSRLKEMAAKAGGRAGAGPVNQTDREKEKEKAKAKAGASEPESGPFKSTQVPGDSGTKMLGPRAQGKLLIGKPVCLSQLDSLNSNSEDGGLAINTEPPPKEPSYSKLQDLAAPSGVGTPCLTPSPAPVLNVNSPSCFGDSALPYPRLSGLHRSMESLSLPMSVAPSDGYPGPQPQDEERPPGGWLPGGKASLTVTERPPNDQCRHESVFSAVLSTFPHYLIANFPTPQQIRKLRRELESSQEKVANLTTQLSANANLVAAFEQSLTLMTARLQSLSVSAEQKDSELLDLRETIENLKTKNTETQAVIQGALNNPNMTPKELRIRRQNSSESISSLNSITSHSSIGSYKDADAKKKKKKSWLKNSFNKAFSIKKGPKSTTSYSDIEEIATPDSSAPSSPKLSHESGDAAPVSLQPPPSAASVSEEGKSIYYLRSELWEKERMLTDIRLEALNSAHHLEQLQEAMNNMQSTVENLKAENDQLKTGTVTTLNPGPTTSTSQPSGLTSLLASSPRQSMTMTLTKSFSMSLNESPVPGWFRCSDKDDCVRVVVCIVDQHVFKDVIKQQDFFIGSIKVNGKTDWTVLDAAICQAFKDYINVVDPASSLGLSTDSIYSYQINHGKRVLGAEPPETTPSRCMAQGPCNVIVTLKGLKEKCVDNLVFETLIPKPMMQHYISLLLKHRRLVLSGPSGTGKTYLTYRLAEYLVERSGREAMEGIAVTYNMHRQSCKDLQLYLSNLANQIDRESGIGELPLVVILDDISDASAISELVNGALTCKYHKCPYIIGTTNQPVKMTPNHGLHLSFRMVTFSNNVEPANGFLVRYLHRKMVEADNDNLESQGLLRVLDWVPKLWYHLHTFLEKHSTSDFLIGPCFFLSCPVTVEEFRSWFIDLWNHSIIPYLQEGAKDGIKIHGQKAAWEDPVEWVRGTLPWPSAQQDQAKLVHLPPPTMAPGGVGQPSEDRVGKENLPSSMESDPLMAMLLKLQESANYIESPDGETSLDPTFQATL